MAEVISLARPQDPPFITYLLSQELQHDCYFIVGNNALERIGVVKKMLLAHSLVLRLELQDSQIAEKGNVELNDVYPDTFKNLLRYVYGFDNTSDLSFDEADNLLYTAEKYMIDSLKDKLSVRLMALLNTDNICTLMNNPACYKHLELNSAITKILQYETKEVLASSHFLDLTSEAFANILKQDALEIPEIDVWRAALTWAKNKAGCEDGQVLRKQLSGLTKYIRICTVSYEDFCQEVVPTSVLTDSEVKLVCLSQGTRGMQDDLSTFYNDIEPRKMLSHKYQADFNDFKIVFCAFRKIRLTILTKKYDIELFPLLFPKKNHNFCMAPEGLTYPCECTVEVTEVTDYQRNTSTLPLITTVQFNQEIEYGKDYEIPITCSGKNVILLHNKKYILKVRFVEEQNNFYYRKGTKTFDNDHFTVSFHYLPENSLNDVGYYSPIKKLLYSLVM